MKHKNLIIVESSNHQDILESLKEHCPNKKAHFTNGTFRYPKEDVALTTITGFGYIQNQQELPIIVAFNSDKSLKDLKVKSNESFKDRYEKIAEPLLKFFPQQKIIFVQYDENTPEELYKLLNKNGFTKNSTLHKWGYGTNPNDKEIVGGNNFDNVYGFPTPKDKKPVCHDITEKSKNNNKNVKVVDLRKSKIFTKVKEYFNTNNNLLLQYQSGKKSLKNKSIPNTKNNSNKNIKDKFKL